MFSSVVLSFSFRKSKVAAGGHLGKIWKAIISATSHPIHYMFGSTVGFSGSVDQTTPLPVGPKLAGLKGPMKNFLENFEWPYLCNGSSDPVHVCSG